MLAVTEPGVHNVTVMVSTQLLKTALLENVFGYFALLDPCPILLLQPKEDAAEQVFEGAHQSASACHACPKERADRARCASHQQRIGVSEPICQHLQFKRESGLYGAECQQHGW
ncbi:phage terminase large subunit family protein [Dyella japonica]|uniref:phage terminase large subunit family protein n=1 Tax=Dyella japonica TaxID=231455 RepID=UPI003397C2BB